MTLRQITLIKFKASASEQDIENIGRGFSELTGLVPGMSRFEFGPDVDLEASTLDYALVIDFDDAMAWRAYREHPRHVAFVQRFMPIIERAERAQYEV